MELTDPDWKPEPVGPFVNEPKWDDKNGDVIFMDDDHWNQWKEGDEAKNGFLAFFYAPWCGHCKAAKPHYADASEQTETPMLAMDCTSFGSDTCNQFGVKSYPTIKWFNSDGTDEAYSGARDTSGFADFCNERGDPNYVKPPPGPFVNEPVWDSDSGDVVFMDDDHFDEWREENKTFLSFFYAPWCGHCKAAKPHYGEASESANAPFVAMDCTGNGKKTCGKFDVSGFPTIKFFDGEGDPVDYSGARSVEGFKSFVNSRVSEKIIGKEEL
jgi:protein disulfide-isomerase-like protein